MIVAPIVISARPNRPANSSPVLASALKAAAKARTPWASWAGLVLTKWRASNASPISTMMPISR